MSDLVSYDGDIFDAANPPKGWASSCILLLCPSFPHSPDQEQGAGGTSRRNDVAQDHDARAAGAGGTTVNA